MLPQKVKDIVNVLISEHVQSDFEHFLNLPDTDLSFARFSTCYGYRHVVLVDFHFLPF